MQSSTRRITLNTLKEKLESCRLKCEALEKQINQPNLPSQKRFELQWRWDEAMKDRNIAQKAFAALELAEKVGCGSDALTPECV